MTVTIGIDVGLKGGIAVLDGTELAYYKMPVIGNEVNAKVICSIFEKHQPILVAVERAQAMPKQGVCSMFNYGVGYGVICGIVQAYQLKLVTIPPRQWQAQMFKLCKNTSDTKQTAAIIAQHLFPKEYFIFEGCRKPHDGAIDATLIAYYAANYLHNTLL